MNFFKNIISYFDLRPTEPKQITPEDIVVKPKPVQKKREKKPFPYYRLVTEWDDATDYQCLACKAVFSIGFNPTNLKFCPTCGIEFEGRFTKQNPRYNQYTLKYPYRPLPSVNIFIKTYHRKDIINKNSGKNMFSIGFGDGIEPITQERLDFTKDKDNYYKWEEVSRDGVYPCFAHKSSKVILKEMLNRMKYYKKTCKTIQLWAGPKGKEKLFKEIIGNDNPYPVGYGLITCSGIIDKSFQIKVSG